MNEITISNKVLNVEEILSTLSSKRLWKEIFTLFQLYQDCEDDIDKLNLEKNIDKKIHANKELVALFDDYIFDSGDDIVDFKLCTDFIADTYAYENDEKVDFYEMKIDTSREFIYFLNTNLQVSFNDLKAILNMLWESGDYYYLTYDIKWIWSDQISVWCTIDNWTNKKRYNFSDFLIIKKLLAFTWMNIYDLMQVDKNKVRKYRKSLHS